MNDFESMHENALKSNALEIMNYLQYEMLNMSKI